MVKYLLASLRLMLYFDIEGMRSRVRYKQNSTRNIATSILEIVLSLPRKLDESQGKTCRITGL